MDKKTFYYVIKPGDTLHKIADLYQTNVETILVLNPTIDPERLMIGQVINLPFITYGPMVCEYVTIKKNDTLYGLAEQYNTTVEAILLANPNVVPKKLMVNEVLCIPQFRTKPKKLECHKIKIKDQDYPYTLAQKYFVSVDDIIKENPGIDVNHLVIGSEICIPINDKNKELLEKEEKEPTGCLYKTIKQGDTFKDVAKEFNVTIVELLKANPALNPNDLKIGEVICIPKKEVIPSTKERNLVENSEERQKPKDEKCIYYTIKANDTIKDLAYTFNVSIESIIQVNKIADPNLIKVGDVICIPKVFAQNNCTYRIIKQGDTFENIADLYNVKVEDIIAANPFLSPKHLQVGQAVCIPSRSGISHCVYYTVKQGDTFANLAKKHNITAESILVLNPHVNPKGLQIGDIICLPRQLMRHQDQIDLDKKGHVELLDKFLRLWYQHVSLTNLMILDVFFNLPTIKKDEKESEKNINDFYFIFNKHIGEDQARRLKKLLSNHITLIKDYIIARKENNLGKAELLIRELKVNGDDIAHLLAQLDKNQNLEIYRSHFEHYLKLVESLVNAYARQEYDTISEIINNLHQKVMHLAKLMVTIIISHYQSE